MVAPRVCGGVCVCGGRCGGGPVSLVFLREVATEEISRVRIVIVVFLMADPIVILGLTGES